MENLLMYVVENLIKYGEIHEREEDVLGEDAWCIMVGDFPWILTRSEILLLNECFNNHIGYLTDDEIRTWNRLFSLLN